MEIVTCLLIGLMAGISSGLFGIGGGIIIVPLLILAFQMTQQKAQGTSLIVLLAPVSGNSRVILGKFRSTAALAESGDSPMG